MSYRVEVAQRAEADLDRLLATVREFSPRAAERLALKFWKGVERLRSHPFACGLAHENPDFPEELRHLIFWANSRRKFRALFVVRDEVAHILCVRAPGEKPVRPEAIETGKRGRTQGPLPFHFSGGPATRLTLPRIPPVGTPPQARPRSARTLPFPPTGGFG